MAVIKPPQANPSINPLAPGATALPGLAGPLAPQAAPLAGQMPAQFAAQNPLLSLAQQGMPGAPSFANAAPASQPFGPPPSELANMGAVPQGPTTIYGPGQDGALTAPPNDPYGPTTRPAPNGDAQLSDLVDGYYTRWRTDRQIHELQWFLSTAMIRGAQDMKMAAQLHDNGQIEAEPRGKARLKVRFNRMLQKYLARQGKYLREPFDPNVLPFTNDRKSKLNAQATERALDYWAAKSAMERKYRIVLNNSQTQGKGFMWLYWDPSKITQIQTTDLFGNKVNDVAAGDVVAEPGSSFEVLVPDPGRSTLMEQDRVMRVKVRLTSVVRQLYGQKANGISGDFTNQEIFQYQRQIAGLSSKGTMGVMTTPDDSDGRSPSYVIVKELFERPSGDFPRGRHVVVAGGKVLLNENELPYGLWDQENPYPVVEFPDLDMPGQFWPPTLVEQLIDVQKAHNLAWAKVLDHLRHAIHPKVFMPVQARMPKNAWHGGAGEVINILQFPGLKGPEVVNPPSLGADIWRIMELLDQEFDKVTSLFPASMGAAGNETSGFQVNLLQEAADAVHGSGIRLHQMAFEEFYFKVRRLMKWGYTVPRLVSITGRNYAAQVFEFGRANIDEHAQIKIYTGSALSKSPAIRNKQVQEMWGSGLLGAPNDPANQRRALRLIDSNGIGELQEEEAVDVELARRRLDLLQQGVPFGARGMVPFPWEDHDIHWEVMTEVFKSPEFEDWSPQASMEAFKVLVWHARWANPAQAYTLAQELGLMDLIPLLEPFVMAQQGAPAAGTPAPQPGAPPPQGQPGPQGHPTPGAPAPGQGKPPTGPPRPAPAALLPR